MTTLLIHHHASLEHENPPGHPERVDRIKAVNQILSHSHFKALKRKQAPLARDEDIMRVHPDGYLAQIREASPEEGFAQIDMDTFMSPSTLEAALRGAGAAVAGGDGGLRGAADYVLCLI